MTVEVIMSEHRAPDQTLDKYSLPDESAL